MLQSPDDTKAFWHAAEPPPASKMALTSLTLELNYGWQGKACSFNTVQASFVKCYYSRSCAFTFANNEICSPPCEYSARWTYLEFPRTFPPKELKIYWDRKHWESHYPLSWCWTALKSKNLLFISVYLSLTLYSVFALQPDLWPFQITRRLTKRVLMGSHQRTWRQVIHGYLNMISHVWNPQATEIKCFYYLWYITHMLSD